MIRVDKPATGPKILSHPKNRGPMLTAVLKFQFDAGIREFEFLHSVYAAKSVKDALLRAQHKKCAFCESKFLQVSFGDVEHFRPKGGWVQSEGEVLNQPGYYWLAYDWKNLFASCQICNQRFKRNLFPIINLASRALSHHADLSAEGRLILDPGEDEPENHIGFRDEYPFPIGGSAQGVSTISALGLDREELAEARRDKIADAKFRVRLIKILRGTIKSGSTDIELIRTLRELESWFHSACKKSAEYSSMLRALFRAEGLI